VAGGTVAGGNEYHLWRWQADTFASSVFSLVGIGPDPAETAGDEAIEQYFRLTSELRAAVEAEAIDLALVDTLTSERAIYENDVERTLERRIGDAVASVGLTRGLPLFNDATITWPPVNIEMTSPPQLLVRSPRDRIERSGDTLLKNDLSVREVERIEADAEGDDTVALVVSIGGLAAYPAIVRDDRSYDSLLETSAHEWVHHYLAFYPLGEIWGDGGDAETLNETAANIAGREIANLVRAAHPIELPAGADGRAPAAPAPTADFTQVMRALRLEVDALLAAGDVVGAEARMEEQRLYLADNGIHIRKLNQAYFAFYGTYADGPASSNPVGPKIEEVWTLTGDVGVFLRTMRDVTTVEKLDAALERLREAAP
ncbi:MAG: hypothetical protein ACSLFM_11500, partial [Tepidiformaceae bacterium]